MKSIVLGAATTRVHRGAGRCPPACAEVARTRVQLRVGEPAVAVQDSDLVGRVCALRANISPIATPSQRPCAR
jgi:hypothetical protein